jgi:ribosomal-protein-alanine N-acetyltransferase
MLKLLNEEFDMTYCVRPMMKEDLTQVSMIDREVFPTQWPPPNYRQELQNKLAHYIVVYDTAKTLDDPVVPSKENRNHFLSRLLPWLRRNHEEDESSRIFRSQYIIGFSGIWLMAGEAHITNIAVREQYQRQGVGELLLVSTIDLSREQRAETMTLEVRESNTIAQNLYSKYGFKQTGIRRGYYLDNREDAIIMSTESINSEVFLAHLQRLRESLAKKLRV